MKSEPQLDLTRHPVPLENAQRDEFAEIFSQCPIPPRTLIDHLALLLNRNCLSRTLFINELYRQIVEVPGAIVEFGVRWGQSMALYSNLRALYEPYNLSRLILGFDTFEGFPSLSPKDGTAANLKVGAYSVGSGYEAYLEKLLAHYENNAPRSGSARFRLIKGDACKTLPEYLDRHPETIVALAYFDFDIYKPTKVCLERILPHLTKGSIIAFDELNKPEVPGETVAVREVIGLNRCRLRRSQFRGFPSYLVFE